MELLNMENLSGIIRSETGLEIYAEIGDNKKYMLILKENETPEDVHNILNCFENCKSFLLLNDYCEDVFKDFVKSEGKEKEIEKICEFSSLIPKIREGIDLYLDGEDCENLPELIKKCIDSFKNEESPVNNIVNMGIVGTCGHRTFYSLDKTDKDFLKIINFHKNHKCKNCQEAAKPKDDDKDTVYILEAGELYSFENGERSKYSVHC